MASMNTEAFTLTSKTITNGKPLPVNTGWKADNKVPDLSWANPPQGTKSLVLIVDDPDAPTKTPWVHWVVFNIPASYKSIPPLGKNKDKDGIRQGINSYNEIGYGGPHPPVGETHRYYFKLYALDTTLDLPGGTTKEKVTAAIKGHILGEAQLMGTYKRS